MTEWLHFHFSLSSIGEGNDNPLQCSCLENPRDGGAWWAAIYGVTQSQIRLELLSSSSSSKKIFFFFFFLCKKIFNSYSYGLDCTPCPNLHVEILPQASISERDLIWRGSLLRQSSLNKVIAVDPNLFWPVSYKKGKFDHRQSKCHVYVKIQFMSQGERPGIDPSFTALRRNQRCQHLNFWTYLFRK